LQGPDPFYDCYTKRGIPPINFDSFDFDGDLLRSIEAVGREHLEMAIVGKLSCREGTEVVHQALYYFHITWVDGRFLDNRLQLAYCLVVKDSGDDTDRYERVGIAILYGPEDTPVSATWPKRTLTII
jgi:hypothetical protein